MGECKEAHSASKVLVTPRRKRIAKVEEKARIDMATVYLVDIPCFGGGANIVTSRRDSLRLTPERTSNGN